MYGGKHPRGKGPRPEHTHPRMSASSACTRGKSFASRRATRAGNIWPEASGRAGRVPCSRPYWRSRRGGHLARYSIGTLVSPRISPARSAPTRCGRRFIASRFHTVSPATSRTGGNGRHLTPTFFGSSCDVPRAARFGARSSLLKSDPLPRTSQFSNRQQLNLKG